METFLLSQLGVTGSWHPVGRGQACSHTPCNAQNSPTTKTERAQMSVVPRLTNPALGGACRRGREAGRMRVTRTCSFVSGTGCNHETLSGSYVIEGGLGCSLKGRSGWWQRRCHLEGTYLRSETHRAWQLNMESVEQQNEYSLVMTLMPLIQGKAAHGLGGTAPPKQPGPLLRDVGRERLL